MLAQGGILTRGNYRDWLRRQLREEPPVRRDGGRADRSDDARPQGARDRRICSARKFSIEYVRNEDHTVTLQTAANVGQVFLGTSMKCASCHDHFENPEWPQDRFLAFAGLFAPADLEHIRCEHEERPAPCRPAFPSTCPARRAKCPAELDGRLHLAAQLITDPANPRFAKSIVNRLWKRYLGLGLFEPVDDFRARRAAPAIPSCSTGWPTTSSSTAAT